MNFKHVPKDRSEEVQGIDDSQKIKNAFSNYPHVCTFSTYSTAVSNVAYKESRSAPNQPAVAVRLRNEEQGEIEINIYIKLKYYAGKNINHSLMFRGRQILWSTKKFLVD